VCIKLLKIVATNSFFAVDYAQYRAPKSKAFETLSLKPSIYTVPIAELEDEQGESVWLVLCIIALHFISLCCGTLCCVALQCTMLSLQRRIFVNLLACLQPKTPLLQCVTVLAVQNLQSLQKATEDSRVAKRLFKAIDSDGSGGIDIEELSELMTALSMTLQRTELEEVGGDDGDDDDDDDDDDDGDEGDGDNDNDVKQQ
jgi:hypothetical protein